MYCTIHVLYWKHATELAKSEDEIPCSSTLGPTTRGISSTCRNYSSSRLSRVSRIGASIQDQERIEEQR
jgi:hypothetical protein